MGTRAQQLRKCAVYFAARTVPLFWVLGLASVFGERIRKDPDSSMLLLLYGSFAVVFLAGISVADLKANGIHGWWALGLTIAGFGVFTLSTWLVWAYR